MSASIEDILNSAHDASPGNTTVPKAIKMISKSPSSSEGGKTSNRAQFSFDYTRRLIMARTFLDKHYDQRINSAQTKMQFVTDSYNEGFVMPAALLVGAEKDIVFGRLQTNEHKTELQLQRKWEALSRFMRDINIASQEQSILNRITVKTHEAGPKRDQEILRTEVYEEIEDSKKKFGFYEVFVECKWDQRDVVSPKNRTSVSYQPCITTSVTAAAPIPTSPLAQVSGSVQVNNSDSAVGSPTIPNSQSSPASVCGAVSSPAAEDDDEELGKRKTKGRLGGGATRPRTGGATGRPSGGRLTTVLIEQEGKRMEQEKKIAGERMVLHSRGHVEIIPAATI
jgi:hypothetical protein